MAKSTKVVVVERGGSCQALASGQKFVLGHPSGIPIPAANGNVTTGSFYLEPDDYVGTKLRVRVASLTNATAPVSDYTIALFPVTLPVGAASTGVTFTAGPVVAASQVTLTAPAASSSLQAVSGEFDWPTAGIYTFGILASASAAANACVNIFIFLEAR